MCKRSAVTTSLLTHTRCCIHPSRTATVTVDPDNSVDMELESDDDDDWTAKVQKLQYPELGCDYLHHQPIAHTYLDLFTPPELGERAVGKLC